MFEKVTPSHPDKIADRIAGAIVDLAYKEQKNPKISVEVLIGHGECFIITESSVKFSYEDIVNIVLRIAGLKKVSLVQNSQDEHLSKNQNGKIRCGDNGIFRGVPVSKEQEVLSDVVYSLYKSFPFDGKYIICDNEIIACQSNVNDSETNSFVELISSKYNFDRIYLNPLGSWTGGLDVDTGATNRKLGSDMGDAVTGGGMHGKDLSKADVSVNIYAHIRAKQLGHTVEFHCAIGDEYVDGLPYSAIVEIARDYIFNYCGGFEKFAEWGLIV